MRLYNCYTGLEKILNEMILADLENKDLVELAQTIKALYEQNFLEDGIIVVNALCQINEELGRRLGK